MAPQTFEIPNSTGGVWLLVALVLPAVLLLMAAFSFWPRPLTVEVTHDTLRIRGSLYGRTVAKSDLDLSRARVVNLNSERTLVPTVRTNGIGLPNYRVGWFRLHSGERALCFLTNSDTVLYLPTTQQFVLLVSVSEPDALLTALKTTE